ncbi:hypothetical protein, partial [Paracoccus sp. (in: a-proteobacteria)]|uniref:hypothetical protein n=1 Tax=Paracoccus sp. TaxID=267 RepID=UPI0035B2E1AF
ALAYFRLIDSLRSDPIITATVLTIPGLLFALGYERLTRICEDGRGLAGCIFGPKGEQSPPINRIRGGS